MCERFRSSQIKAKLVTRMHTTILMYRSCMKGGKLCLRASHFHIDLVRNAVSDFDRLDLAYSLQVLKCIDRHCRYTCALTYKAWSVQACKNDHHVTKQACGRG